MSSIHNFSDLTIATASLHPPHLTVSKGLPALIPFCAYQGNLEVFGEYIEGLDFPVCNSFKPKILNGELCYALKFSSQKLGLKTRAGRGKGLLLAIDKGTSIEPEAHQPTVAKRKNFIRTELRPRGKKARIRILTSHWHDDSRPGKYAMKNLKVMAATENFLAMPDDVKGCQMETMEDCKSRHYVQKVRKTCGCSPWSLSSVASIQVRRQIFMNNPSPRITLYVCLITSNRFLLRLTTSALQMKLSVRQP